MAANLRRTTLQAFSLLQKQPSGLLLRSCHQWQSNSSSLQRICMSYSLLKFIRGLPCVTHNANNKLKFGHKTFHSSNGHNGATFNFKPTSNHFSTHSLPERPSSSAVPFDSIVSSSSLKRASLHQRHNYEHVHRRHLHHLSPFQRSTSSSNQPLLLSHSLLSKTKNGFQNNICHPRPLSIAKSILDASPAIWQPYLRLIRFDKPIGTWLLYWPCTWSIALASQPGSLPDLKMLALFGAGSFFMRGAGCIINDMWDKDFDSKVARTKDRPLANGDLTYFQALTFLGIQLSISLAILLQLNWYTVFLGASSMIFVITYPLAKRFTYWPQIVLGLTFNYGALVGWSAIQGSVDWSVCLPLYGSCILWTLVYDTIYAHQDKYDDMLVGVKSTALRLGEQTKPWLTCFTAIMASGLVSSGLSLEMPWPYYLGVGVTTTRLLQQIYKVDLDDAEQCGRAFRGNFYLGVVMFAGIVMANLMKSDEKTRKDQEQREALE